ncbi:hypothetical protein B4U80_10995 [Leptotrombidium deliense]|uniref:TIL domain-containing protein n=1 Tax=Leptotrombidium deliense TaxID=299467 RepID=A0A443S1X8_9ACAR|nr:hypothetical protein B4U80_10995 [Leptotrombidium deliense]
MSCMSACGAAACACKNGFVRKSKGLCVKPSEC